MKQSLLNLEFTHKSRTSRIQVKIILLTLCVLLGSTFSNAATKTWNNAAGGPWTTAGNWTPSGAPSTGDDVTLIGTSASITAMPTISLNSLTVNGTTQLEAGASGNTLTITGTLTVASGGFQLGLGASGARMNFTLAATATGTINGTSNIDFDAGTTTRTFQVDGTLTIAPSAFVTDANASGNSNFVLSSGATLKIGNTVGITTTGATGAIQCTGTRTYSTGANYEYNGTAAQVTGNGLTQNTPANLTINNSAGVTLSAATTISGLLTMTGGTLNMANQNLTVGSLTGSSNITNSSGAAGNRTIAVGSDNTSPAVYSGVISNGTATSVLLTKSGSGTLTLSGSSSYSGATTISAGTLSINTIANSGSNSAIGTGSTTPAISIGATGVLQYTGSGHSSTRAVILTASGGTIDASGSGTLTLSGGVTGNTFGLVLTGTGLGVESGVIATTSGTLTKNGTGTWTLSAANTFTGLTTVSVGTLKYGINNALSSGAVIVSGGTLDIVTFTDAVGAVTLTSGTIAGTSGILTGTSYAMQSGSVTAILAGAIALTKTTSGTVTMSGVNTYSGITTINAGILSVGTIGNGGVAGNLGQATNAAANLVLSGGTLQYTGSTASTNRAYTLTAATSSSIDVTLAGTTLTISGAGANTSGSLSKIGLGTLLISGANAYTGGTTITDGTLTLGAAGVLADAGQIILDGGTLKTGATTGFSETVATLDLSDNSTIALGTGNHALNFTASNAVSWTAGKFLTITGWIGGYNGTSAGTNPRIFVGSTASGLTTSQLTQIQFFNGSIYFPATILSTGEVVPTTTNLIATNSVSGSPFCPGASGISVSFTYSLPSAFIIGTATFTVQLSSNTGSFTTPTNLQTVASDATGSQSLNITLPFSTTAGTAYRIRVVSNSPAVNGVDNGSDLTVNAVPTTTNVSICTAGTGSLTATATCPTVTGVTSSTNDAATGADNNAVGTVTWTNPGNVISNNNIYATVAVNNSTSHYLKATNYGFSLPSNATITGIQVTIGRLGTIGAGADVRDNVVSLVNGSGTVVGNNKAVVGTDWTNVETAVAYGATNDTWAASLTATDVNSTNFGVALAVNSTTSRTASVDYIQVTITYTDNGTLTWYTVSSGGTAIGTGSPFNPVGVLNSGLANTNTPGTTPYYVECSTSATGCRGEADFVISAPPVATFSYIGTPYCSNASNPSPTFSGGGIAGTFSASPAGLNFVSTATGQVNISTSTAGTYTVTNTVIGTCTVTSTSTITITTLPVATFSYTGTPYCSNAANPSPTFSGGGAAGTFSASPAGLNFVSTATGQVNVATSTAGTYTVTNTRAAAGGCGVVTSTSTITITTLPVATFSYTGTPYCSNAANPSPTFSGGGAAGTFSASPAGLNFVSTATGQVNVATSTAGTYTVTNTRAAAGGCGVVTSTSTITITTLPVATFSYTGTPYCSNAANPSPTFSGGGAAGTFSASPAGLNFVSTATGQVNVATSTAGTYTVTNTIAAAGGCGVVTSTSTITITTLPVATFSYTGTPYCSNAANPSPTFSGGGAAGTFSASPAGLNFVSTATGQVNVATSTAGTYTVTNTIAAAGGCGVVTSTSTITITTLPVATFSYTGTPYCSNAANPSPTFSGGGAAGTFSASPAGLNFVSTATGQVNVATSTAGTYTVTNTIAAAGGCGVVTSTSTITITTLPTATISYGGSPFCSSVVGAQSVTQTGTAGGTYTATAGGLTINAGNGDITPSSSTAGTYTVTYTIASAGGCSAVTATTSVIVVAPPTVSNAGSNATICISGASLSANTPSPGTGAWSIASGPSLNAAQFSSTSNPSATFTPAGGAGVYNLVWTISNPPCTASTSTVTITVVTTGTWLGNISSDWYNANNWCGGVPTSSSNVTVPSGAANMPIISGTGAVCANITINSLATLTMDNTADLSVSGNWTNNGSFVSGGGTVSFVGTGNQTISGSNSFDILTINNSAGVTANNNVSITSLLDLENGVVATGSNSIVIEQNASSAAVNGYVNGNVKVYTVTGSGVGLSFPVGSAGNYSPMDVFIDSVSTAGYITGRTDGGDHPNIATSGFDQTKTVNRYWTITNNTATLMGNYSLGLQYDSSDKDGTFLEAYAGVKTYSGASWSDLSTTWNFGNYQYTAGISTFGAMQIGQVNPMPALYSLTPNQAARGTTLDVLFNGAGYLTGISSVNAPAGITINSTTVNDDQNMTVNITISPSAAVGSRMFAVTNLAPGGGTSDSLAFTITIASVTASFIASNTAVRCNVDGTAEFINSSTGATSYSWNFGAGATPATFTTSSTAPITVSYSSTGTKTIQLIATNGVTSDTLTRTAYINVTALGPLPVTAITGPTSVCSLGINPINYSIAPSVGATNYTWAVPTGVSIQSGNGTSSVNLVFSNTFTTGTVSVTASNACAGSTPKTITVVKSPVAPGTISGPSSLCGLSTAIYSITPVNGATTYTWVAPVGTSISSGQGSTIVTLTVTSSLTSTITVTAGNTCNTSNPSSKNLTGTPIPATPGTIYGPTSVCNAGTVTYYCYVTQNTTIYNWTVPSGMSILSGNTTSTISVAVSPSTSIAGNVTVTPQNGCNTGNPKSLAVNSNPAVLGNITGSTDNICLSIAGNLTQTYSVAPIAGGVLYNWTVPAGASITGGQNTTSISLTFTTAFVSGSQISVTAANACSSTGIRYYRLFKVPDIPAVVNVIGATCTSGAIFTTPLINGAVSYNWTVPAGLTIVSGQGSTAITTSKTGPIAGDVTVQAINSCGKSNARLFPVSCASSLFSQQDDRVAGITANIYPNPTAGEFTIEIDNQQPTVNNQQLTIEVYDVLGNVVMSKKQNVVTGNTAVKTTVEGMKNGLYFVRIVDAENNIVYSNTLIKQ